jgi:RHS repeat-associated protein
LKQAKETIPNQTGWQQTFNYDRFGNRSFDEANTTTLPKLCLENGLPVVCANDRKSLNPTAQQTDNRFTLAEDYEYDANGNMTRDADGRRFVYDALNKQTQVKDSNNQPLGNYVYDGDGKRIKKLGNTENTLFVYDAFGSLVAEYAITPPPPTNPTPQVNYLTTDTLGSPRIVTGKNGEILSRRDFMPFGEEISRTNYGSDTVRGKFTGYEKDIESSLEFAQNRYYANKHGRFTTPDPLMASGKVWNPQSWNRYAYVGNNPLNITDPLGLEGDEDKKPWWYLPATCKPGEWCKPIYGTDYTSEDQLISPDNLITVTRTGGLVALNPFTGKRMLFAQTAEGMAEALKWMAAGGAAAPLIAEGFAAVVAGIAIGAVAAAAKAGIDAYPYSGVCMANPGPGCEISAYRAQLEVESRALSDEQLNEMVPPVDMANTATPNPQNDGEPPNDGNRPTQSNETDRPIQVHHFATNKHKTFTPQMERIAKRYGLDLDGDWNKMSLPHQGRHPSAYHRFVLRGMQRAAREAGKNRGRFLELFDRYVKQPIINNPDLLRRNGWR